MSHAFVAQDLAFVFATEDEARRAYKMVQENDLLGAMKSLIVPEEVFESFELDGSNVLINNRAIPRIDA